jgi:hypothetical protein
MFDRVMTDPLRASFLPILSALSFCWLMWALLKNEDSDHQWWGDFMVRLKLAPDEDAAVDSGRTWFKWLTYLALAAFLVQGGRYVWREHPLHGQAQISPDSHPDLPKAYGAGGSGVIIPGKTPPVPKYVQDAASKKPAAKDQPEEAPAKKGLGKRGEDINENN